MPNNMRNEEPLYLVGLCFRVPFYTDINDIYLAHRPLVNLDSARRDEKGCPISDACYDNPLFTEDDDRDHKVSAGRCPNGSGAGLQDGRVSMAKDYMHPLPPGSSVPEIRFAEKKRRRFLLKFFVICLIVVIIVALLIGLIVHFMHMPDSTSLRTPSSSVKNLSRQLQGSLTIVGGPFSVYKEEYEDNSSSSFSLLLQSFQFKMDSIFTHSSFKDMYSRTDILRVSSGSVILQFIIRLNELRPLSSADTLEMTSLIQDGLQGSIFVVKEESVTLEMDISAPVTKVNISAHCDVISIPRCVNVTSYQKAAFPNVLGHPNQDVANHAMIQLLHTMSEFCHGYVSSFLCGLFMPECGPDSKPIPPCRSFCRDVYLHCNHTLAPGASFPVDCNTLPDSDSTAVCMPNPYKPGVCVPIRENLCRQEGFNSTVFPNVLGSEGEDQIKPFITLFKGLEAATTCYKYSMLFGCSALLSPCSNHQAGGRPYILPCKSLCRAYKDRCEIFMDIFYSPWPDSLDCNRLEDSPDPRVCVGYAEAHEVPEPGECKMGEMRCDNTRCIKSSWLCDGYQDCKDNSDESHCALCQPNEVVCSPVSTLCINSTNVCDGADHCYQGVDEAKCVRVGDVNDTRALEIQNQAREEWEEVCSKGWNQTFALLSCRQLGYSGVLTHSLETPTAGRSKAVLTGLRPDTRPDRLQSFLTKGQASCPVGDDYVVKLSCWEPVCGTRPANYESLLRVVGGDEVKPGTWPWLVSMHGGVDRKFFCGASVISPEWILTAGHCVGGGTRNTSYWTLIAGHTRRPAYSPYRQIRKPKKLFLHPEFNFQTVDNDLALIQLEKPLVLSDYLRPVCLPNSRQEIEIGTRCYVAGWGRTNSSEDVYEPAVRQVNLDVVTWESCMASVQRSKAPVPYKLTHNMFCAGGAAGHDACQGDSGGPFMCRMPNATDQWYQAGVVSWGIGCAIPNSPGIYTKLHLYADWISQTIRNNTGRT